MDQNYPLYGSTPPSPGLWLGLFHGRKHPQEQLDGWGENGPLIGPLNYVHTTYAWQLKIEFANPADAARYGFDDEAIHLEVKGDLLFFNDRYYGDWTSFVHLPG